MRQNPETDIVHTWNSALHTPRFLKKDLYIVKYVVDLREPSLLIGH